MMDRHFTDAALRVLQGASAEARTLRHAYTYAEHIALSLLRHPDCAAAVLLDEVWLTADEVRAELLKNIRPSDAAYNEELDTPFSIEAEAVITRAGNCADTSHCEVVGTQHFLFALIEDTGSYAAQAFFSVYEKHHSMPAGTGHKSLSSLLLNKARSYDPLQGDTFNPMILSANLFGALEKTFGLSSMSEEEIAQLEVALIRDASFVTRIMDEMAGVRLKKGQTPAVASLVLSLSTAILKLRREESKHNMVISKGISALMRYRGESPINVRTYLP